MKRRASSNSIRKASQFRASLNVKQLQVLQVLDFLRDGHKTLAGVDVELLKGSALSKTVGDIFKGAVLEQMKFEELLAVALVLKKFPHVRKGHIKGGEIETVVDFRQRIQRSRGDNFE